MAEEPIVDIDPNGDLVLETSVKDHETKRFRVCSRALRRQSPVWDLMLFDPRKESKPADGENWVVQLVGDCADALEIVLYIIHAKFDLVPDCLPIDTLHQLVIIINKYHAISIVRPWCNQWLEPVREFCLGPREQIKSLYIAWELGDEQTFALRLEQLAVLTFTDSQGHLLLNGYIDLEAEECMGPQNVLGKSGREPTVAKLQDLY